MRISLDHIQDKSSRAHHQSSQLPIFKTAFAIQLFKKNLSTFASTFVKKCFHKLNEKMNEDVELMKNFHK